MGHDWNTPQALLRSMRSWFGTIERGANVLITVENVPFNGFVLVAKWRNGQEHRKHYSAPYIAAHRNRRACMHAKDFLGELLQARWVV
jgi:hypothetical protein